MCVFQKGHDEELLSSQRIVSENSFKKPLYNGVYEATTTSKNGGNAITMSQLKFNVNVSDLKELMELKGVEAKEKLEERFGSVELLASQLKTDIQNGISATKEDLDMRVKLYGKNEIPPKPPKSFIRLAFEAVQDTTLIMLITCAILSITLSFYHPEVEKIDEEFGSNREVEEANLEWVEGVAIMIAVIVVVFVTAFNDWRKERQFRGLQDRIESDHLASVIRNGKIIQINVKYLVVGDICCIKYGDSIPADGVIVQSSDLKIDESSLTGETDLIKKNLTDNLTILSGTHVMEGTGQFLVLAVGLNSQTGIIMTLLGATKGDNKDPENKTKTKTKKHRSVLQIKLGKLALQIGYGGMIAALCTFIILVARMFVKELIIEQKPWSNKYIKYILSFLTQGLTVIVVAVPEGLPLAVTLALAFAVRVSG
jgi:Ca2+ transporting ATPase